jgi:hypothetical protein
MRLFPLVALWTLAGCPAESIPDPAPPSPENDTGVEMDGGDRRAVRILFIGNSLTSTNDLPAAVQKLARAHVQEWSDVSVDAVAPGGKLLAGHAKDLSTPGTSLHTLLGSGPGWDFVVLQEQSQVPGLGASDPYLQQSISSAVSLAAAARDAGAVPVLYMTWGFWNGDATNADTYPDFTTMGVRLDDGYTAMANAIQPAPLVAPVGRAFRAAHADTPEALDGGSLFRRLFSDDRHPTPLGTYLASAVIAGTLSGERMVDAGYLPAGISAEDAALLRRWADEVVFEGRYAAP